MYIIKKGKLTRRNPFCPRCGKGTFMVDHGNFYSCGKCGDRYSKETFGRRMVVCARAQKVDVEDLRWIHKYIKIQFSEFYL